MITHLGRIRSMLMTNYKSQLVDYLVYKTIITASTNQIVVDKRVRPPQSTDLWSSLWFKAKHTNSNSKTFSITKVSKLFGNTKSPLKMCLFKCTLQLLNEKPSLLGKATTTTIKPKIKKYNLTLS